MKDWYAEFDALIVAKAPNEPIILQGLPRTATVAEGGDFTLSIKSPRRRGL